MSDASRQIITPGATGALPFPRLTRRQVVGQAWPIILGQSLIPMVGLVDATVIGRTGDAAALAGVALGATVINLIFWTFGFLRMGITGLTAQAQGAGSDAEVSAILLRGLVAGAGLGLAVLMLAPILIPAALTAMHAPTTSSAEAAAFVGLRFAGAPAALSFYAINGWLIGLGRTRLALVCQLVLNIANIGLDLLFVSGAGLGVRGVGLGTALADWCSLLCGLLVIGRVLGPSWWRPLVSRAAEILRWRDMRSMVAVNLDIMVRTLALLLLFTWFSRSGARLGAVPLAANHVLMQLVGISAFVLDGFAFTAEHRVGQAIGAGSRSGLLRGIRLTGEFSIGGGLVFLVLFYASGQAIIAFVTSNVQVRLVAEAMLGYCSLVPVIGMPSWLLDGIFIGATRGRALRNAALIALLAYLATDMALRGLGDDGVWIALLASYAYRAIALGAALPRLVRQTGRPIAPTGESMPA